MAKKSKLLALFSGLSKADKRNLGKYLQKPIGNKSSKALLLFNLLKNNPPKLDFDLLTEKVFYKLYPKNHKFIPQRLRETATDLTRLIEEYLVVNEALEKKKTALLIIAQRRRNMTRLMYKNLQKLKEEPTVEENYPLIPINEALYFHPFTDKSRKGEADKLLENSIVSLDRFYYTKRLCLFCEQVTRKTSECNKADIEEIPRIIDHLNKPQFQEDKLLQVYKMLAEIYYTENPNNYPTLKKYIVTNLSSFSKENQHLIIGNAINLVRFFVKGNRLEEYFEWYKLGLEIDAFLEDGVFSKSHFNNIVHVACNLKKYEWLKNFIRQYKDQLPSSRDMSDLELLMKAYIAFGNNDYKSTARFLIQISFVDISYALRWHVLSMKCSYQENQFTTEIQDRGKKFNRYLKRRFDKSQITESTMTENSTFIDFVSKLSEYNPSKLSPGYFDLVNFEEEVKNAGIFVEKRWLLEMILALKNSNP